jgi:uncharacterized protein
MLDPQYLSLVLMIFAFAAFTQGFTGLGFGIIAIAGIAFTTWDLERATVVTNLLLIALSATILYSGRKNAKVDWKLVGVIILGTIVGIPLGYGFIFALGDQAVFRLALGAVLLIFAFHGLFRPALKKQLHLIVGTAAGIVSGFFAGAFTAGGPPLALFVYSRQKNPMDAMCTLQIVFLTATVWRLINIILFGKGISAEILSITAVSFPVIIVFTALGYSLAKRLPSETFLKVAYIFVGFAGLINIIKGFQGLNW